MNDCIESQTVPPRVREVGDFNTGIASRRLLCPPEQRLFGRNILLPDNNIRDLEQGEIKSATFAVILMIFIIISISNANLFSYNSLGFFLQRCRNIGKQQQTTSCEKIHACDLVCLYALGPFSMLQMLWAFQKLWVQLQVQIYDLTYCSL